MSLQFIQDTKGNTTGVFIPIEEWQSMKETYSGLQDEEMESNLDLVSWQRKIIDQRLSDYHLNPNEVADFDKTINDIEESL